MPPDEGQAAATAPAPRVLAAGHLHPGILFLRLLDGLRQMVLPALLGALVEPWFFALAVVLFVTNMAYGLARYLTFKYRLTEEELITTEGILHRQERRIPVNRIQDLSFESTIVRRIFGLVVVMVETASGKGAEARLDSLGRANAGQLREALLRMRSQQSAPAGAAGGEAGAETGAVEAMAPELPPEYLAFRSTTGELMLRGLTDTRLGAIAIGLFAVLEFAGELGLGDEVNSVLGGFLDWLFGFPWPVITVLVLALFFVVLLGGMAVSAAAAMVMFHGFHLTLRGDVAQRRYGLLTTRAASLPLRKIQRITIEQPLLRRLLGVGAMRADSAGSGMNEAQEVKRGSDIIVPLAQVPKAEALVPYLLPGMEPWTLVWYRVSPRVVVRIFLKGVLLTGLLLGAGLPLIGLDALVALVVLPAAWLVGFLSYQNLAYARDSEHLALRWGVFGRYRALIPYRKVQAVVLRAGPVERLLGLATLTVYVAGGSPTRLANLPRGEAEGLRMAVADAAGHSRFVW